MNQEVASIDLIYEPVQAQLTQVEAQLQGLASQGHAMLSELLEHVARSHGKRIRPAIALLASSFYPDGEDLPIIMATAVELLHLASLVHDDTVDNSPMRRGNATVSSHWGRNVAVLLGDYIFATSATFVSGTNNLRVIRQFSETITELSTGELMEILGAFKWDHTYEQYKERIYNKTASLFRTAAESGAVLSGVPEATVQSLSQYGYGLGMAFQIVDDILDFEATEEEVGKPVGNDLLQGTITLPTILLLQRYPDNNPIVKLCQGEDPEANHQRALEMVYNSTVIQDSYVVARQFCDDAASAIQRLPSTPARQSLLELASYVIERRR